MSGTNDVYAGLIPPAAGCGGVCGLGGGGAAIFFVNESEIALRAAFQLPLHGVPTAEGLSDSCPVELR